MAAGEPDLEEAARAKKAMAEAALREKQNAEIAARAAKLRAEKAAQAAAERERSRIACASLYWATADKKIKDLTVREEQQVRACQALGLYAP